MSEQKFENVSEFVNDVYLASLSALQANSPFLNHKVVNTRHNNINEIQLIPGEYAKYNIDDCINFPVLVDKLMRLTCKSELWNLDPVDNFMRQKGINYINRFSKAIEYHILTIINRLFIPSINMQDGNYFISHKKSSIIAHPYFIEDHPEFFDNYLNNTDNKNTLYSWHKCSNLALDIYVSELLSENEALLFHDGSLMVPFIKMPDQHPFPCANSVDKVSNITFQFTLGSVPMLNYKAYVYQCMIGAGVFPGSVVKLMSKKYEDDKELEKNYHNS